MAARAARWVKGSAAKACPAPRRARGRAQVLLPRLPGARTRRARASSPAPTARCSSLEPKKLEIACKQARGHPLPATPTCCWDASTAAAAREPPAGRCQSRASDRGRCIELKQQAGGSHGRRGESLATGEVQAGERASPPWAAAGACQPPQGAAESRCAGPRRLGRPGARRWDLAARPGAPASALPQGGRRALGQQRTEFPGPRPAVATRALLRVRGSRCVGASGL